MKTPAIARQPKSIGEETSRADLGLLERSLGYLLKRTELAVTGDFRRRLATLGLRPTTFTILAVVDQTPGLSQSVIADKMGVLRTNIVALVDELQTARWIERVRANRKAYGLHLTEAGRVILREAFVLHDVNERRIAQSINSVGRDVLAATLHGILAVFSREILDRAE